MAAQKDNVVKLSEIVGSGYGEFWRDKHRYRVLKGGRASKKSTTTALWFIANIMKYPQANALVVRKTYNTHHDSTFSALKWAAERLGVSKYWQFKENPLEAIYKPTKQRILFRGFDDVLKLTSITVDKGVLCWVWLEEAFEIDDEADFQTLDETIRGELPEGSGLWKQITLTYNPWVNSHWTKSRFFDRQDPDAFTLTTTYRCNEWLDDADRALIEKLRETDPERYKVVGEGEYGIPGGAFFDEFRKDIHTCKPFKIPHDWRRYVTIDYGRDMLAAYWIAVDWHNKAYCYRELHKPGLFVSEAAELIKKYNVDEHGQQEKIYQWFAPNDLDNKNSQTGKSTLDLLRESGLPFIKVSNRKVDGCVCMHEWLRPYQDEQEIWTSPLTFFTTCVNVINSISSIQCDEKDPNIFADQPHELTHSVTAIMYFTAGRPRSGKEATIEKYPVNSLEYRVQKNLDRLTKKTRRTYEW
jgi:phage terminase large subunit